MTPFWFVLSLLLAVTKTFLKGECNILRSFGVFLFLKFAAENLIRVLPFAFCMYERFEN